MIEEITRRDFVFNGSRALFGLSVLGNLGCSNEQEIRKMEFIDFKTFPVEQVFRDSRGYRIYFTNEKEIVVEKYFLNHCDRYFNTGSYRNEIVLAEEIENSFKHFRSKRESDVILIRDLKKNEIGYANVINFKRYIQGYSGNHKLTYAEIHLARNQKLSPGIKMEDYKMNSSTQMNEIK